MLLYVVKITLSEDFGTPPYRPRHRGPSEKERNRERAARHQAAKATASTASSGTAVPGSVTAEVPPPSAPTAPVSHPNPPPRTPIVALEHPLQLWKISLSVNCVIMNPHRNMA